MATVRSILTVDVGTASTKVALFDLVEGQLVAVAQADAPTTADPPAADVTAGLRQALAEVETASGRTLAGPDGLPRVARGSGAGEGAEVLAVTVSAGGPFRAAVAGVVREISGESALRAALAAGATVVEQLAVNDGRLPHERVKALRRAAADVLLLAGGVDEGLFEHGSGRQIVAVAQQIRQGLARPRHDPGAPFPVVYAGSLEARDQVEAVFARAAPEGPRVEFIVAENVRPEVEVEHVEPAAGVLGELFRERLAPSDPRLAALHRAAAGRLVPTSVAVGEVIRWLARSWEGNLLCVDAGPVGVDVHTAMAGRYVRSRWSLPGPDAPPVEDVAPWLPVALEPGAVEDWLGNRALAPCAVPEGWSDLFLEHARLRACIAEALATHHAVAQELKGTQRLGDIGKKIQMAFGRDTERLLDLMQVDAVIGAGGLLAAAPDPRQAALVLLDAVQPAGLTYLALDRRGWLPHLGALVVEHPELATEVLAGAWLQAVGTAVAPVKRGFVPRVRPGTGLAQVVLEVGTDAYRAAIDAGELTVLPLGEGETGRLLITPARDQDFGAGPGQRVRAEVAGGLLGVILDGRGRPIEPPAEPGSDRVWAWCRAVGAYPEAARPAAEAVGAGAPASGGSGGRLAAAGGRRREP